MILDEIASRKRVEIASSKREVRPAEMRARAAAARPAKGFAANLRGRTVAVIAEIKRASPSRGAINAEADVASVCRAYSENGAAAVSVLTDSHFNGDSNDMLTARAACELPLLRKDFILDEYQIYESRALGADAVLLIVALLDDSQLREYHLLAEVLGMSALVEAHDEIEVERAVDSGARLAGINNRNLSDFTVDLYTTRRLAPLFPPEVTLIAESGISSKSDVESLATSGIDAVLVGEALMRADDIGQVLNDLAAVRRLTRRQRHAVSLPGRER